MEQAKIGIDSFRDEILKHFNKLQTEHNELQAKYKEAVQERNVANIQRDMAVKDVSLALKERDRSIVEKVNAIKDKIAMSQDRDKAYVDRVRTTGLLDEALEEIERLKAKIENLQNDLSDCQDELASMTEERNYYFEDSQKLNDGLKRLEVNTFDEWKLLEREIFEKLNGEIELSPQEQLEHELVEKHKEATFYKMTLNSRIIDIGRELKEVDDELEPSKARMLISIAIDLESRKALWESRIKDIELDLQHLKASGDEISDVNNDTDNEAYNKSNSEISNEVSNEIDNEADNKLNDEAHNGDAI